MGLSRGEYSFVMLLGAILTVCSVILFDTLKIRDPRKLILNGQLLVVLFSITYLVVIYINSKGIVIGILIVKEVLLFMCIMIVEAGVQIELQESFEISQ
jgi:phosphatidylserine synthase